MSCLRSNDLLQRRLDGEPIADPILNAHLRECAECRARFAAATRLETGLARLTLPTPPDGMSARLTRRLGAEARAMRRGRLLRRTLAAALAASLLVAIAVWQLLGLGGRPPEPGLKEPAPIVRHDPEPIRLQEKMVQAGESMVAVLDRAVDQTRKVLPQMSGPELADPMPSLDTPAQALREAGQGVGAGFEPVAASARRAVGLLIHMTPLEPEDRSGF
jgi:hypothetical protein